MIRRIVDSLLPAEMLSHVGGFFVAESNFYATRYEGEEKV
jgi:hypothetical protein